MPAARTTRTHCRWLPRILLALLVIAADMAIAPAPVFAQDRGVGLLRGLFMRREPVERVEPREFRPRERRQRQARRDRQVRRERQVKPKPARTKRATSRAATSKPEAQSVAKLDDARTVVVVGDFMGGGLAEGLETVFEQAPGIRILDRTNGSSGFVRDDFYDWPGEIGAILDADEPAAVVVMIGSNDRQEIGSEAVRSPAWTAEYEARIKEFTTSISERNIPLVWIGMPSFKSSSMSSDMLAFNDIYRRAAEGVANGVFVDIWDGFVDENGNFSAHGPDINGQPVQLRSRDGINLTRDGKRKVAFYAEKPLGKILGDAPPPEAEFFGPEIPLGLGIGTPDSPAVDRTLPVSLNDPELDGGTELLGAAPRPAPNGSLTPAERLTIEGIAPPPPPGRADDFARRSAPRPATAATEVPAKTAGPLVQ